jgi:hypothetical protein
MSAFWAQVVAAVAGALATGGVKILTNWLQTRAKTGKTVLPQVVPPATEEAE